MVQTQLFSRCVCMRNKPIKTAQVETGFGFRAMKAPEPIKRDPQPLRRPPIRRIS